MTYDRSSIMTKANRLRAVYGLSRSEALCKSWGLAKLARLERTKAVLECKERMSEKDFQTVRTLNAAILELKNALFPKIVKQHRHDRLTAEQRERMTRTLAQLKAVENPTWQVEERIWNIEDKLNNSIETWTSSEFDESAYSVA